MTVASIDTSSVSALLQRLISAQAAQSTNSVEGLSAPGGDIGSANGAGPPPGPPPLKPNDGAASLFSPDTLSSIVSQQSASPSADASTSSVGAKLFSALDTNKDGTISQGELQQALANVDPQSGTSGPHHHHHHHHAQAAQSATDAASAATAKTADAATAVAATTSTLETAATAA